MKDTRAGTDAPSLANAAATAKEITGPDGTIRPVNEPIRMPVNPASAPRKRPMISVGMSFTINPAAARAQIIRGTILTNCSTARVRPSFRLSSRRESENAANNAAAMKMT